MTNYLFNRVLLVDDNEMAVELMALIFREFGYEVRVANNHIAGYEMALDFLPHVICSDVGQPPEFGMGLATAIRRNRSFDNVLLIAITGWGDPETTAQIYAAGFNQKMTKPVNFEILEKIIRKFFDEKSMASS